MKFAARNLAGFAARPDEKIAAVLLYGEDAMRVALKRQDLLKTYLGPAAEEEMRLTRLAAADLRKDPAALTDAAKAQGFFPGVRAVLAEDAGDNAVAAAEAARNVRREMCAMAGDSLKAVTCFDIAREARARAFPLILPRPWCRWTQPSVTESTIGLQLS